MLMEPNKAEMAVHGCYHVDTVCVGACDYIGDPIISTNNTVSDGRSRDRFVVLNGKFCRDALF